MAPTRNSSYKDCLNFSYLTLAALMGKGLPHFAVLFCRFKMFANGLSFGFWGETVSMDGTVHLKIIWTRSYKKIPAGIFTLLLKRPNKEAKNCYISDLIGRIAAYRKILLKNILKVCLKEHKLNGILWLNWYF